MSESQEKTCPNSQSTIARLELRSKTHTRQSHLDLYKHEGSVGDATITSLGDTTTANMLMNMLTLSHHQEPNLTVRARFIPNETMFVQDDIER